MTICTKSIVIRGTILGWLMLLGSIAMAQGTYTQIDYPGAVITECFGINNAGEIVGLYGDASGIAHGFLLSGGEYSTIDYPGATFGTELHGLNGVGQIVGYTDGSPVVGFAYDITTQTFETVAYPGSASTFPLAINDSGTVVGYFAPRANLPRGYALKGTTYMFVRPPGTQESVLSGITKSGVFAGYVTTQRGSNVIFLVKQGTFLLAAIPTNDEPHTALAGVNPAGDTLAGVYQPTLGFPAGFLYKDNVLTTLQYPGAIDTIAEGVNDSGVAVGYFSESSGSTHGLMWNP